MALVGLRIVLEPNTEFFTLDYIHVLCTLYSMSSVKGNTNYLSSILPLLIVGGPKPVKTSSSAVSKPVVLRIFAMFTGCRSWQYCMFRWIFRPLNIFIWQYESNNTTGRDKHCKFMCNYHDPNIQLRGWQRYSSTDIFRIFVPKILKPSGALAEFNYLLLVPSLVSSRTFS
jgi:hypothetical protein